MSDANRSDEAAYQPPRQFPGKYRGTVEVNLDPLLMGRLVVRVPALPGSLLNWALPCVPYAGPDVGMYLIPPVGARVWVEFEGGDPNWPIWSGCFWDEGEIPGFGDPLVKLIQTPTATLSLSDVPEAGGVTLTVREPGCALPLEMSFTSRGVQIVAEDVNLLLNAEAIVLTTAETVVTVSPETVTVALEPVTVAITAEGITVEAPETSVIGNVNVEGAVEITGDVDITGATEITGDLEVTGAVEIVGDVDVTGAVEITGGMELAGAGSIEGEFNVLGAVTIEGDNTVLGILDVAGDVAVAGLIEGVVVPPF